MWWHQSETQIPVATGHILRLPGSAQCTIHKKEQFSNAMYYLFSSRTPQQELWSCSTQATTRTGISDSFPLFLGLHHILLEHGIQHSTCQGSHGEALGCHTHVDQVQGQFHVTSVLQLVQPVGNHGGEASHPNGHKWRLLKLFYQLRGLAGLCLIVRVNGFLAG